MGYCYAFYYVSQWVTTVSMLHYYYVSHVSHGLLLCYILLGISMRYYLCILLCISMGYCYAIYNRFMYLNGLLLCILAMYLNGLLLCILLGISMGYCYCTVFGLLLCIFTMYLNGLLLCISRISDYVSAQWVTVYLRLLLSAACISMGYCYAFYYVSQWVTVMHFTRYLNELLENANSSMGYCNILTYVSQ